MSDKLIYNNPCPECGYELTEQVIKKGNSSNQYFVKNRNQKLSRFNCDACGHSEGALKTSEKNSERYIKETIKLYDQGDISQNENDKRLGEAYYHPS